MADVTIHTNVTGPTGSPDGDLAGAGAGGSVGAVKPANIFADSHTNDATDYDPGHIAPDGTWIPGIPPKPPLIDWSLNSSGAAAVAMLRLQMGLVEVRKSAAESQMNDQANILKLAKDLQQNRKNQADQDRDMKIMEVVGSSASVAGALGQLVGHAKASSAYNEQMKKVQSDAGAGGAGGGAGYDHTTGTFKFDAQKDPVAIHASSSPLAEVASPGINDPVPQQIDIAQKQQYNERIKTLRNAESQAANAQSSTKALFDIANQGLTSGVDIGTKTQTAADIRQKGEYSGEEAVITANKELMARLADRHAQLVSDAADIIRELIQAQKEISSANNSIVSGR